MVLSTSSVNLKYSNRPLRRLPYPWFKLKFCFAVKDPHSDIASFKRLPYRQAFAHEYAVLHRGFVLFSTPIPRCSSNHCLDSVGFLFAREQIKSTEMSSKSTFLSPYHYDFPLVTRSPSTPMKINRYIVIFVTLNADALMAIRPVGFEPTIADSKGQCLKPIWPWTQNKKLAWVDSNHRQPG